MLTTWKRFKQRSFKEATLFLGLLFFGLVLMPIGIYLIGQEVFGDYAGRGYSEFFGRLSGKFRGREVATWFLVLSPYLAWQVIRLTVAGWRTLGERAKQRS